MLIASITNTNINNVIININEIMAKYCMECTFCQCVLVLYVKNDLSKEKYYDKNISQN